MPVLARELEQAGTPTVVVTPMPDGADHLLAPRVVGVEFPFGHTFGPPGDRRTQRRVLETALTVLAGARSPGTRVDVDLVWPQSRGEAYKAWQPKEPSPIVAVLMKGPEDGLAFWRGLLEHGVYVNLVVPPAAPNGGSLLRASVSAAHEL